MTGRVIPFFFFWFIFNWERKCYTDLKFRLNNLVALHNKESMIKTLSQFAFSNDLYTIFVGFIFTLLISKLTYSKFYGTNLFYNPETHGD